MSKTELAALLAAQRRGGDRNVPYIEPTPSERLAHLRWVSALARAALAAASGADVTAPAGFALSAVPGALWLLHEQPEHRRGAGALALRLGTASALLVEAPHTFFDAGTLPIALAIFERSQARALCINTVHRAAVARAVDAHARADAARGGELISDVAHQPPAFFSAAHDALLLALGPISTLQVHGFRDDREPRFDVVLSDSGSRFDLGQLRGALHALCPPLRVGVYPHDTPELGGTRNAQALASIKAHAPFVHMEMGSTLRQRLTREPEQLTTFASAVAVLARQAPR